MTEKLKKWINESDSIVFFGGAGVSCESGIPDFRSKDGVFDVIRKFGYSPEELLSVEFFHRNPAVFFEYYRKTLSKTGFFPNPAHLALASLERSGKLKCVITQNVDNLHQMAGSRCVYELHGSAYRNYCTKCGKFHSIDFINTTFPVPLCECGGTVKPDVVLYGEPLDEEVFGEAVRQVSRADMLIVGGTSLSVYPAASIIRYYSGNRLVLINKDSTPYDNYADLLIYDSIGSVLGRAVNTDE